MCPASAFGTTSLGRGRTFDGGKKVPTAARAATALPQSEHSAASAGLFRCAVLACVGFSFPAFNFNKGEVKG